MKIQLIDRNKEMCNQWKLQFKDCNDVVIHCGDYFSLETECIVSPANSFGFMDGGIDYAIMCYYENNYNIDIEQKVKYRIEHDFEGELLVGQGCFLDLSSRYSKTEAPSLIVAPTMRVPMKLSNDSVNVYLSMKAILNKLKFLQNFSTCLNSVSISGLGTGVGEVPYDVCALQMKQAYNDVWLNEYTIPNTFEEAQKRHQLLYSNEFKDLQF